jgi:hypothetical protein
VVPFATRISSKGEGVVAVGVGPVGKNKRGTASLAVGFPSYQYGRRTTTEKQIHQPHPNGLRIFVKLTQEQRRSRRLILPFIVVTNPGYAGFID